MKRFLAQLGAALYFAAALSFVVLPAVEAENLTIVGSSGAPTNAPYYVTTANTGLSAEVVPSADVQALLDDAAFSNMRTTLGLGTAALVNTGTSGGTIPLLSGNLTFSGQVIISNTLLLGAGNVFFWNSRATMQSPADGVITLGNTAQADFLRLQFGGTTASFPALKRNAAGLDLRTANDGAYSFLTVSALEIGAATDTTLGRTSAGIANIEGVDISTASNTLTMTNKTLTTPVVSSFTVAGLPAAGTAGRIAMVTDQTTACPANGAALTGGGAVACMAFDNGSAWVGM